MVVVLAVVLVLLLLADMMNEDLRLVVSFEFV